MARAVDGNTADLDRYAQSKGLGAWSAKIKFYGPAEGAAGAVGVCQGTLLDESPVRRSRTAN